VNKAWIVARHEFLTTVRRVWFVVVTFVLPLVFGGLVFGMTRIAQQAVEESTAAVRGKDLGYVDHWGGLLRREGFRKFETEEAAKAALVAKTIGSYLVVPKNYLDRDSRIVVNVTRRPTVMTAERPPLPDGVYDWLLSSVLHDSLSPDRVARAKNPFNHQMKYLDEKGEVSDENDEETKQRAVAAYAFFVLLLTSIFTSSAYLLQGMAEE
jgi:ABC-2 type transport system permease protein